MTAQATALTASTDIRQASVPEDAATIGRRAATGVVWTLLGWMSTKLLNTVSYLLLAWVLAPADFGVVAFAMIAINAFVSLQELGVPEAMIYRRDSTHVAGTALTINVGAALVLAGLVVLVSPLLARLGGDDQVGPVATALAFGLVLSSLGSVQRAMLEKELNFRRRLIADLIPLAGSGCIAIALALWGLGVWSLVTGFLVKCGVSSLILWCLSSIRPRPEFQWPVARNLLGYGGHVSVNSVLQIVVPHLDFFIVGHFLGVAALGLYAIAFTFANLIIAVSHKISEVTFPAYSRLNHDRASLNQMFGDVFNVVWTAILPMCVVVFICAPPFVTAFMGEKWAGAVDALKVLTLFGALRSFQIFGPVYKSVGRPDLQWKANVARLLISAPLTLYAVQFGIVGVAFAQVATFLVILPLHAVLLDRKVGFALRRFWQCLWPALAGGAVMGLFIGIAYALPALRGATTEPLGAIALSAVALVGYAAVLVGVNSRVIELGRKGAAVFTEWRVSQAARSAGSRAGAAG